MSVDLLAIMAHPDDAELLCGGTLAKAVDLGRTVGILDLTAGEGGSFGNQTMRAAEAADAARIIGATLRQTAGLPDSRLENSVAARDAVADILRELKPKTVILHWPDARHPDHHAASEIGRAACFVAGIGGGQRPHKILYALTYQEAHLKPTFVVDITAQMSRKLDAIFAFASQFGGDKKSMGDVMGGATRPLREQILAHHAHYGSLIRTDYGEPFWTKETVMVEDVVGLGGRSM
jgi:N-acetylglucosamine malate deacetylase 1